MACAVTFARVFRAATLVGALGLALQLAASCAKYEAVPEGTASACTEGVSYSCACADRSAGSKRCENQRFSTCVCSGGDGSVSLAESGTSDAGTEDVKPFDAKAPESDDTCELLVASGGVRPLQKGAPLGVKLSIDRYRDDRAPSCALAPGPDGVAGFDIRETGSVAITLLSFTGPGDPVLSVRRGTCETRVDSACSVIGIAGPQFVQVKVTAGDRIFVYWDVTSTSVKAGDEIEFSAALIP
jgi:hypothetical protein